MALQPGHVVGNSGVDAVNALAATLLRPPPGHQALGDPPPRVGVLHHKRTPAVPQAGVSPPFEEARTEHVFRDVVLPVARGVAGPALLLVHHRQLHILQDVGALAQVRGRGVVHGDVGVGDAPARDQAERVGLGKRAVLAGRGQAHRHGQAAEGHALAQLHQGDVVVVVAGVKVRVQEHALHRAVDGQALAGDVVEAEVDADVLGRNGDHAGVSPMGAQHVGGGQNPPLGQQRSAAEPAAFWDTGHVFHHEQSLPGEQAGHRAPASHNPLLQSWQRLPRLSTHCKHTHTRAHTPQYSLSNAFKLLHTLKCAHEHKPIYAKSKFMTAGQFRSTLCV